MSFQAANLDQPPSAHDVAEYAAEMARHLCAMCESAGLSGLATLFYASQLEAGRALIRLGQPPPKAAAGDAA